MAIVVDPSLKELVTHHVSLTDQDGVAIGLIICDAQGNADGKAISRAPIDRQAFKMASGNQKYSDLNTPWSTIVQTDWSGGRGSEDFDNDITRFLDSYRANTIFGSIINGPQEHWCKGYRKQEMNLPGSVSWCSLSGSRRYFAVKITPADSIDVTEIWFHLKRKGSPGNLTVELCANSAGKPGLILQTAAITTTDIPDIVSRFYRVAISSQGLTAGVDYWLKVYGNADDDDDNCWKVGVNAVAGTSKESGDDSTWSIASLDLYYRLTETITNYTRRLFRFRRAMYQILNPVSGAPKILMNGDRGMADSNAGQLTKLIDATKAWATNEWVGCKALLIGGPGSNEPDPWRTVTANNATSLTVDPAWKVEHTTATEYVIVNSEKWSEVEAATHGLTGPVTDILVVNNILYLAQGDSINIRRGKWNTATGAFDWADDGANKATYLTTVRENDGLKIWRANNLDASSNRSVSVSVVMDWPNNLNFATLVTFKDDYGNITNLAEYGDTDKQLWVFREAVPFTLIKSGATYIPDEIPLSELHTVMSTANGRSVITNNVYLIFSLRSRVEKYYNRALDDVGPNRDEGLPGERKGVISALMSYPSAYFAAVDAGEDGTSSLLLNNGSNNGAAWHEVFRAPMPGMRITSIEYQAIDGAPDRLWITLGDDVLWFDYPDDTLDPSKDDNMNFTHEAVVVSGYMYAGLYDAVKLFYALKLFTENLVEDEQFVEVDYRVDQDITWIPITDSFDQSPTKKNELGDYGINGKRLQLRFRLQTTDCTKTPKIKASVVDDISLVEVKYSFALSYRLEDNEVNLRGERENITAAQKQMQLNYWAENAIPLRFRSIYEEYDDQVLFINPIASRPIAKNKERYINNLTMIQVNDGRRLSIS